MSGSHAPSLVLVTSLVLALLAASPAWASHLHPPAGTGIETATWSGRDAAAVTFRSVAYLADGSALLAGGTASTDTVQARQVLVRWTPTTMTTVIDRAGAPFTGLSVRADGTALVLAQHDMLLLGHPDDGETGFRDLWAEAIARKTFANPVNEGPFSFIGLDVAWHGDGMRALVAGSSLLEYVAANDTNEGKGPLRVVHGGADAFFDVVAWEPRSRFNALVAGGVVTDDRFVLGVVWRLAGTKLSQEDTAVIYGVFARTRALVNTIAFRPDGTEAVISGRDGAGASFLRFDPVAYAAYRQSIASGSTSTADYADYMPTLKPDGSITSAAWSKHERLIMVGRATDTIMLSDGTMAVPLIHRGPELLGVAWHPDGRSALAVGPAGIIVTIVPPLGPHGAVIVPRPDSFLVPGQTVSVRAFAMPAEVEVTEVRVRPGPDAAWSDARLDVRSGYWNATVDPGSLPDGQYRMTIELTDSAGRRSNLTHPFIINNAEFMPETPTGLRLSGLEGDQLDSDGLFNLSWTSPDTGVNFQVERVRDGNTPAVFDAGPGGSLAIAADEDGTYTLRVRAANRVATGNWSVPITLNVVLDRDGDGVPDKYDPNPFVADVWGDRDGDGVPDLLEGRQCSDPADAKSTPASDDDGDGFQNGIECQLGTDPKDAADYPGVVVPPDNGTPPPPVNGDGNGSPGFGAVALTLALIVGATARRRFKRS